MPVPAVPGSGLVVIEAELILGGLEAILDGPAMAFYRHQLCHGRSLRTPSGEEGKICRIGDAAPDQQAARPWAGEGVAVFAGIEIGQFEIGPIVQPRTFGSFARRQAPPGVLGETLSNVSSGSASPQLLAPGMEHVIG